MTTLLTAKVCRLLFAPVVVIAIAVLVKGYASVGDGFSAGVIVALGVLLQYLALGRREAERLLPIRFLPALAFVGMLLALAVATVPLLLGDPILTHLPAPGADVVELGTLELITAVAFDVAVFLLVIGSSVGIIHTLAAIATEEGGPSQ